MSPAQQEANRLLAANPNHPAQVIADLVQRFSDIAACVQRNCVTAGDMPESVHMLAPFILPEPVDPLVDAMSEAMCGIPGEDYTKPAADLRAELAKRGLEIVPVQP